MTIERNTKIRVIEKPIEKIVHVDISNERVGKFEKQLDEMKTMARDAEAALEEEVRLLKHQLDEQEKRCDAAEEEARVLREKLEDDTSDTSV